MWISKAEYNELVRKAEKAETLSKKWGEAAVDLSTTKLDLMLSNSKRDKYKAESEALTDLVVERDKEIAELHRLLDKSDKHIASLEKELESTKRAYESEHAEATEYFNEYYRTKKELDKLKQLLTQVEEENKEVERMREELAKEASGLARELTHAEVDLALYQKAFDDIAHAFGDEFRYLLMKEAIIEEQHPVEARYATWVVSDLWFVVHDIMKNAGWRVDEDDDT